MVSWAGLASGQLSLTLPAPTAESLPVPPVGSRDTALGYIPDHNMFLRVLHGQRI